MNLISSYLACFFCGCLINSSHAQPRKPFLSGTGSLPPKTSPAPPPPPPPTVNPAMLNCLVQPVTLTTYLSVDVIGNPRVIAESDLKALKATFISAYDTLGQFNCDRLFRRIENVDIQVYDFQKRGRIPRGITLIYKVEFSCRGDKCLLPAVLFSQRDGFLDRGDVGDPGGPAGGGSSLLLTDNVCGDCQTDNPSQRSPSPRQFTARYRDAIRQLNLTAVESVINILEIVEKDCPAEETEFQETVYFELEGDPLEAVADSDVQLLADTFLSSYNYFSGVGCDGRFLTLKSVAIDTTPIVDETRKLASSVSFKFYLRGLITGACKLCGSNKSLVNDASRLRLRRELEKRGLRGNFMTRRDLERQTEEQFLLAGISMDSYVAAMHADCVTCAELPSGPRSMVVASAAPSVTPSSSPSRQLPGVSIFGEDDCFCAKQEVDFEGQKVNLTDAVNATFVDERDDGRFQQLDNFRSVQFGMKI